MSTAQKSKRRKRKVSKAQTYNACRQADRARRARRRARTERRERERRQFKFRVKVVRYYKKPPVGAPGWALRRTAHNHPGAGRHPRDRADGR